MELNPDFSDLLSTFSEAGVEYLIVGGYAVAAYGHVRATKDIDVFVRATTSNAARVIAALRKFGAPLAQVTAEDFATPGTVFQIGVAPVRIDIITEVSGLSFEEAWRERTIRRIGGLDVPVPSIASLRKNKLASARPQDLADVRALEALAQADAGPREPAPPASRSKPKRAKRKS